MATDVPDDFRCPISLEIMSDPVILSSGHTFDRPSIERWLDAGNRTCPITKLPLSEPPSLIPNHVLRSIISNYTHVSLPVLQSEPDPQVLIQYLTSPSSSLDSRLTSLDKLSRLSKRDSAVRRRLTESGIVSCVLRCVASEDEFLQEKALRLLLIMSLDDDSKVGLVAEGAISYVVDVLRCGYCDSKAMAATMLTSLAVVEVNKVTIGAFPYAIRALVSLLECGNERGKKEACTALFVLCSFADNRRRCVECGAVGILLEMVNSGMERAVEALGLLAKCKEGREEMLKYVDCLRILIRVVRSGCSRGVQYALLTLTLLCSCSERMCFEALEVGVFDLCVGFMEDDSEKVRINASNLIQVLRESCS